MHGGSNPLARTYEIIEHMGFYALHKCFLPECEIMTANAKYCCRGHAVTINNSLSPKRQAQPRPCGHCGNEEVTGKQKYCSACRGKTLRDRSQDRYLQVVKQWLAGEESGTNPRGFGARTFVYRYVWETRGQRCEGVNGEPCGWSKANPWTGKVTLQLEHKDGDRSNNRPENLQLICGACHTLTATYAALNSDKNRAKRGLPPLSYSRQRKPSARDRKYRENTRVLSDTIVIL